MRFTFYLLLLSLYTPFLFAQQNEQADSLAKQIKTVPIVAYWEEGDSWQYILHKGEIKSEKDSVKSREIVTHHISCEVLKATPTSYSLQWSYDSIAFINENVKPKPTKRKMQEMFEGVSFVFQTDEMGRFDSILNYEIVADTLKSRFNQAIEEANAMEKMIFSALLDEQSDYEFVENNFKEVINYHAYHGLEFSADTTMTEILESTNKLGGKVKVLQESTLKLDEENEGIFIIEDKMTPDNQQISSQTKALLNMLKGMDKEKLEGMMGAEQTKIVQREKYAFDYNYGLLVYYIYEDTTTFGDHSRVKFEVLELK